MSGEKKNDKKINVINNYYQFDEDKKQYQLIKDSLMPNFNMEEKIKLIEDYLYYNKWSEISEKSRDNQSASESYYVVGRINGKYFIKRLLDYTSKH